MADYIEVTPATLTTVPSGNNGKPMGGTELINANLKKALPELCDQVQIIMSRPEEVKLDPDKPKILWLQDLPNDPASACLKDPEYRKQFNRIVFASHWQQWMYNAYLGIPFSEGTVIKNGVPLIKGVTLPKPIPDGKLNFIYTSTPHRGLAVLAAAAEMLAKERQDWVLDVYSSFHIYGWHDSDKQMQPLYEQLQKNPCVRYHGSVPNDEVREAVKAAHVFVYPSIYAETSCMAVQEALMAGCLGITSNFGALPETCAEWTWMMQFSEDPNHMIWQTHTLMNRALDKYSSPFVQNILETQTVYYQSFYSFEGRIAAWRGLLEQAIKDGPKREMFVYG